MFNFENPSLHGHGAQVRPTIAPPQILMLSFAHDGLQAHTILAAAKLAHLMNRVLLINGSAPWAFNRCPSTAFAPPSLHMRAPESFF